MERPGVHPRWIKQNDLGKKPKPHYTDAQVEQVVAAVEFCATADAEEVYLRTKAGVFRDPLDRWWTWLSTPCDQYRAHMLDRFQARTLETLEWDHEHSSRCADATELYSFLALHNRKRGVENGKPFFITSVKEAAFGVVLLLVEGETDRALRLADAIVSATRWVPYKPLASSFTETFLIEMLADYLGREPARITTPVYPQKGWFDPRPFYTALRESWSTADPQKIAPLLLAAYDCHTQLSWTGTKFHEREFTNGFWPRTPLAVMLVCKLRELEGLANPTLEHPLLESALGRVPRPGYVKDPVIAKLRERLAGDGVRIDETLSWYAGDTLPA